MRLLALLVIGLCVSPVWAQPDTAVKRFLPRAPAPSAERLPAPPEGVEKTIRDFVDDANRDQFVNAQDKIYGARHGFFGANEWSQKPKPWGAFDIVIQNISEPQIKGESATVMVKYHLEARKNENGELLATKEEQEAGAREQSETLSLKMAYLPFVQESKVWQVVPSETEPTLVKGGPLLAFVIYKMAQKPLPRSGSGAESLKRLKAIGLAARQFVADFDDQFAFSPDYVREALAPYLKGSQSWFVPGTLDTYSFNASLSERYHFDVIGGEVDLEAVEVFPAPPEPFIKNARNVVMFYEGHDQRPVFRYDGKAAICFIDGHTALVTPDEARNLIWNPT